MFHDLRTAWRSLVRNPLFTLAAAGSLALGIGACTVIFSVVYALLLRPLPYPKPAELVHIGMGNPAFPRGAFGGLAPETLKSLRRVPGSGLAAVAGFGYDYANLTGVAAPAQLTVGLVTADYFRVYAVAPQLGRPFTDADCRAASAPVVMLTNRLWRTHFNSASDIIGQAISLDGKARTVVGVMPAGFKDLNDGCDFWQPLAEDGPEMSANTTRRYITSGRLSEASDAARGHLRAVLATLSSNLAQTEPVNNKGWHLEFHPLAGGILIGESAQQALWLLLGAVGCVLLVTCANVANLQLVRAAVRRREIGVRLALGSSRGRLMRYAFTESLLLAGVGAGLGILLAAWGVDAVAALLPSGYSPLQDGIRLDLPVLGFSVVLAVAAGLVTGLLPAWAAARQEPAGSLAASRGRGASEGLGGVRVRAVLVVAEIALALVLLVGAGLMGRSLLAVLRTDAGMRLDQTLLLNLSLSSTHYADKGSKAEFFRRVLGSINAVPGVSGTGMTMTAPFSWYEDFRFRLPGQDANAPETVRQSAVSETINPLGFATLGIPLRRGRVFNDGDVASAPKVLVVNEEFVRKYLPEGNAIGRRITTSSGTDWEIIGVVGNVRRGGLDQDAPAQGYFCYLQSPEPYATLCVRASGAIDPESLTHSVEAAIWQIDADQPIGNVTTLEKAARGTVAFKRLYLALFGVFAGLTLVLATLGIYGTVAYSVTQRTREIGIRLALGAQKEDVLRLVLGQGVRLTVLGLVLGLVAAAGLGRLLTSLLYGVKATDPATLIAVVIVLGAAAFLATYLPAQRAMRVDPLEALREE